MSAQQWETPEVDFVYELYLELHYSNAEAKVREATSNNPWGPSSAIMMELSEYTFLHDISTGSKWGPNSEMCLTDRCTQCVL